MKWTGVLFIIGKPSQAQPSGARGRNVLMLPSAVEQAVRDLPGKPLWFAEPGEGHDRALPPFGWIESASIEGDMLVLKGELSKVKNSTFLSLAADGETLGLSYDAIECYVADKNAASVYLVDEATFLGAHVLLQSQAAHRTDTLFWIEGE